jgi:hypothetical protein
MPTVIWDRSNPVLNAQIPQIFDCEDAIGEPPSNPSSEGDEDGEDDEMQFDMDLGAG